ncbi:MAG: MFS transporter [Myxococcota bacterium]
MPPMTVANLSRGFRCLVGAQFLGAFNDNLFKQLILFLAAGMLFPGKDMQGLAFAVFSLPFVLFSGVAGDLSERFSKRSIIVSMKWTEIGVMLLGAWALQSQNWTFLLVTLFLMGAQSAIFGPSKYGSIPELVEPQQLLQANGTIAMTTFLAVLLGQAIAGPLMDRFGQQLWQPGAFCVAFAVVGTFISVGIHHLPPQKPNLSILLNPFGRLWNTVGMLRDTDGLLTIVLLNSLFWFNGSVLNQAIVSLGEPAYLAIGPGEKSLLSYILVTLSLSIILGSLLAPGVARHIGAGRTALFGGIAMIAGQCALVLIGPVFNHHNHGIYVTHCIIAWVGLTGALFVVPIQSFMQHGPPPGSRGQTFAVNNFLNFAFMFLGGLYYLLARRPAFDIGPTIAQCLAAGVMLSVLVAKRRAVLAIRMERSP